MAGHKRAQLTKGLVEWTGGWVFWKILLQLVVFKNGGGSPKISICYYQFESGAINPAPRTLLKTVIMAWAPSLSRCAKSMHVVPTISSAFLFTLIVSTQGRLGTRKLSPQLQRTARFSQHELLKVFCWDESLGKPNGDSIPHPFARISFTYHIVNVWVWVLVWVWVCLCLCLCVVWCGVCVGWWKWNSSEILWETVRLPAGNFSHLKPIPSPSSSSRKACCHLRLGPESPSRCQGESMPGRMLLHGCDSSHPQNQTTAWPP